MYNIVGPVRESVDHLSCKWEIQIKCFTFINNLTMKSAIYSNCDDIIQLSGDFGWMEGILQFHSGLPSPPPTLADSNLNKQLNAK